MSDEITIEYPQVAALLKRLQQIFPEGVPFRAPERLWFVVPSVEDDKADPALSEAELQLLRQAVEKGLNRSWSDVHIVTDRETLNSVEAASLWNKCRNAMRVIFLGVDRLKVAQPLIEGLSGDRIIETSSLKEVLNDPLVKKAFWSDIKPLALPR